MGNDHAFKPREKRIRRDKHISEGRDYLPSVTRFSFIVSNFLKKRFDDKEFDGLSAIKMTFEGLTQLLPLTKI